MDHTTIKVPAGVRHPEAYQRAVARKIEARARKARMEKVRERNTLWLAQDANRVGLIVQLTAAVRDNPDNEFYRSLYDRFCEWGGMTEKQEAALKRSFERRAELKAQREAENAEAAATSEYFGSEGARGEWRLTLERQFYLDRYGFWINSLADPDGNRAAYLGNKLEMEVGESRPIRATVKRHEVRDGVKQTVLSRPVVQPERQSEGEFLASRHTKSNMKGIKL